MGAYNFYKDVELVYRFVRIDSTVPISILVNDKQEVFLPAGLWKFDTQNVLGFEKRNLFRFQVGCKTNSFSNILIQTTDVDIDDSSQTAVTKVSTYGLNQNSSSIFYDTREFSPQVCIGSIVKIYDSSGSLIFNNKIYGVRMSNEEPKPVPLKSEPKPVPLKSEPISVTLKSLTGDFSYNYGDSYQVEVLKPVTHFVSVPSSFSDTFISKVTSFIPVICIQTGSVYTNMFLTFAYLHTLSDSSWNYVPLGVSPGEYSLFFYF